jgi:hypothetical protein
MTQAEMRAELAALIIERDGRFYRPDGSEIPFTRLKAGKRSQLGYAPPRQGGLGVFETADWGDVLKDGRPRAKIFDPSYPEADSSYLVLPCRPAA